jgi:hypothetical protein
MNYYGKDNTLEIAAGITNTFGYARSDLHFTDFIVVTEKDINNILYHRLNLKGFKNDNLPFDLTGSYKNGESNCPSGGGKLNGDRDGTTDDKYYFYRGIGASDCLKYLKDLGIV